MQRYFINNEWIKNNKIYITGDDYHHIRNVMRMRINQEALFCDEDEQVYLASLEEYLSHEAVFIIKEKVNHQPELIYEVTIAHGLVRRDKQEEVIRRITELGAKRYIPVIMERSIIKVRDKEDHKRERMLKIIKEASEQSHRTKMMELSNIVSFNELLNISTQYDLLMFAYEESGRNGNSTFKKALEEFVGQKILVLVGPEGGFNPQEVEVLLQHNFKSIGLGPRILRTETAPLYIMSAISYELELGEQNDS